MIMNNTVKSLSPFTCCSPVISCRVSHGNRSLNELFRAKLGCCIISGPSVRSSNVRYRKLWILHFGRVEGRASGKNVTKMWIHVCLCVFGRVCMFVCVCVCVCVTYFRYDLPVLNVNKTSFYCIVSCKWTHSNRVHRHTHIQACTQARAGNVQQRHILKPILVVADVIRR